MKEKPVKENKKFSSAILCIVTTVYIALCAMVMGALYVKVPTFGDIFLCFVREYATLLAGIPVLIGVLVTKQQLDANRRQHVATVKYNLRSQLEPLKLIKKHMQYIKTPSFEHISKANKEEIRFQFLAVPNTCKIRFKENFNDFARERYCNILKELNDFIYLFKDPQIDEFTLESRYTILQERADSLDKYCDLIYAELSQYWS